jgi:hypothetical protein
MAVTPIVATIDVLELDSAWFQGTLEDEQGDPVTLASVDSITLTLYGASPDDIINSRDEVNVLNTNGGTFHATTGVFTMQFESDDNPILNTSNDAGVREDHYALFVATWDSGVGRKSWIVKLRVKQLHRVP